MLWEVLTQVTLPKRGQYSSKISCLHQTWPCIVEKQKHFCCSATQLLQTDPTAIFCFGSDRDPSIHSFIYSSIHPSIHRSWADSSEESLSSFSWKLDQSRWTLPQDGAQIPARRLQSVPADQAAADSQRVRRSIKTNTLKTNRWGDEEAFIPLSRSTLRSKMAVSPANKQISRISLHPSIQ